MADRLGLDDEFPGGGWLDRFRNREGKIGGSEATLLGILQACPQTTNAIVYNTRRGRLEAVRRGPWGDPGAWSSTMTTALVIYLQKLGVPASIKRLDAAFSVFAELARTDPLMEYLNGLVWDGVPRVGGWLHRYANAASDEIICDIGTMFLIAMVARAVEPGCQCDYALCLEGDQGVGKTQIARTLGGEYFAADLPNFHSRDSQQIACSSLVIEVGELAAVRHSNLERVKSFLTTTEDSYVPKYERYVVTRKRWCVFIFTVNPDGAGHLVDDTGNRRIWPVTVNEVDIGALRRDRDQLLAEAMHLYRKGVKWWPTETMQWEKLGEEQAARMVEDAWLPVIMEKLETGLAGDPLTTTGILTHVLDFAAKDIERSHAMRVGKIMKQLGFVRYQARGSKGERQWFYKLLSPPPPSENPLLKTFSELSNHSSHSGDSGDSGDREQKEGHED